MARPTAGLGVYLFLAVMDRTARNVSYLVENLKGAPFEIIRKDIEQQPLH